MGSLSNDKADWGKIKGHIGVPEWGLFCYSLYFFTIIIVGALASIPLLAYGIRGFINLEECDIGALHSLDAFNFLTGLLFATVVVVVVLFFVLVLRLAYNGSKMVIVHYLTFILLVLAMISVFGDVVYSFYIASQVYGQFDQFQQGQINCSSSVYYSSFVSIVLIYLYAFVEIGLAAFLYVLVGLL